MAIFKIDFFKKFWRKICKNFLHILLWIFQNMQEIKMVI